MSQSIKITLAILALAALAIGAFFISNLFPVTTVAAAAPTNVASVTVIGTGEAVGAPDEARLQVGVETIRESADEAMAQNEATIQTIMQALTNLGIAEADIQTANYNLWAEQRYDENGQLQGIVGYHVSNQLNVTIRDISKVGDVLSQAAAAGANNIYGVTFAVSDPAALEAIAREKAVANARERAASLAALSGKELGDVLIVTEVIGAPAPMFEGAYLRDQAGGGVAVAEGSLTFITNVQVTFELK